MVAPPSVSPTSRRHVLGISADHRVRWHRTGGRHGARRCIGVSAVVSKDPPPPRVASERCDFSDGWSQLQLGCSSSPGPVARSHAPLSGGLNVERVLLLNATYEPLALVSDRR